MLVLFFNIRIRAQSLVDTLEVMASKYEVGEGTELKIQNQEEEEEERCEEEDDESKAEEIIFLVFVVYILIVVHYYHERIVLDINR